jgi:hypothetical protein
MFGHMRMSDGLSIKSILTYLLNENRHFGIHFPRAFPCQIQRKGFKSGIRDCIRVKVKARGPCPGLLTGPFLVHLYFAQRLATRRRHA